MSNIRKVDSLIVMNAIKKMFLESSYVIGKDVYNSISAAALDEDSLIAKEVLDQLLKNYDIAMEERIPICQDTGYAVIFVDIGQEVVVENGSLTNAIEEGVRQAYEEGFLRKSIVDDPIFERKNTNDNTPPVIHYNIVEGNKIDIMITAKGFGSENMSAIKMLSPSDGLEGVEKFVLETVKNAGPNPCPPIIIGIGVGGTMEKAAIMAKKATMREINKYNENINYENLEKELLVRINELGIGPAGFGGKTTALAVNIDYYPTHIAGLPVAINISCHASRHAHVIL